MKIHKFNKSHIPAIESWFKAHEWDLPEWNTIPKGAFVAKEGKKLLAFNYFFKTEIKNIAIMGVTIGNPFIDKELRNVALDNITAHLLKKVEEAKVGYFFYFADKNPMVERMQRHGMFMTDNGNAYILMKAFGDKNLKYFDE